MPIIRITNRKRPKNKENRLERQQRQGNQARWLVNGSTATHEERLGLLDAKDDRTSSPDEARDASA